MQVKTCFVHLVTYNTMVKTELKMFCKYKHMQI
jgi:hypothetical protein